MEMQISGVLDAIPITKRQSRWRRFCADPQLYLAECIASKLPARPQFDSSTAFVHNIQDKSEPISIVCISDTHNTTPAFLPAHILLHAGDLTEKGTFEELDSQLSWLSGLSTNSFPNKIVIAGNHDRFLDKDYVDAHPKQRLVEKENEANTLLEWNDVRYLQDQSMTVTVNHRQIKIHGVPYTPDCGSWAFQYPRIRDFWHRRIPDGTDILLCHGPPRGRRDRTSSGDKAGCQHLLKEIWRARPKFVVCGHIHESRGIEVIDFNSRRDRAVDLINIGTRGFAGWRAVAVLSSMLVWTRFLSPIRLYSNKRSENICIVVNAAVVGGLASIDQKNAIRIQI